MNFSDLQQSGERKQAWLQSWTYTHIAKKGETMSIQTQIESVLKELLKPTFLEVVNESSMHNVPKGSESHFKVTLVSDRFKGKVLVQRHRLIYSALSEREITYHALAISAYSVEEWEKKLMKKGFDSPKCLGGSKA